MNYDQILSDIHKKNFAPVYFLTGDEPYFIDMISDTIENEALDEADRAFNQIVLYGRDVDVETIANHARSFPMMGERMVVIVKEAQDVKNLEEFEKYLDTIPETTLLVFAYKYKKFDKRKTLAKKIDKKGVWFESKKLYDSNIPGWIQNYLKGEGYSITPKATQMLADYLGTDLHKIANELKKLIIALPKKKSIDDADVERNIGISKDYNGFELQNAIGSRDVLKANRIVNYFGDNGKDNPLLVTVITLYGYFTKLIKLHTTQDKSQGNLASVLGVNPFFVKDYLAAARNYPPATCIRCISILREFDLKSKGYESGDVSEKDLYREMIFKLMH
ncbi:MAG: DNA polymerase III subunit delta [Bacteroidales bacterium]|jgi:DNA polymerase-3 subunit delta|nr:DNA polymerase III subunit delta [Bacteroidales bacterium]MBR5631245.1 DNA polymerase III subunit delta [Bacteroidales bacterium]